MVVAYKKKINIFIGLYILLNILLGGYMLFNPGQDEGLNILDLLLLPLALISFGCLFYGLYNYAKAKGYSGWLALLGFLQILGLIILVVLPDKHKNG